MRFLKGKLGNRSDNVNTDDELYWDVLGCNKAVTGLQLVRWFRWFRWSRWSRRSRWSGWSAQMIFIKKINGFHSLNNKIIKKSWDVTPLTDERSNGRKVENRAVFCKTRNRNWKIKRLLEASTLSHVNEGLRVTSFYETAYLSKIKVGKGHSWYLSILGHHRII